MKKNYFKKRVQLKIHNLFNFFQLFCLQLEAPRCKLVMKKISKIKSKEKYQETGFRVNLSIHFDYWSKEL